MHTICTPYAQYSTKHAVALYDAHLAGYFEITVLHVLSISWLLHQEVGFSYVSALCTYVNSKIYTIEQWGDKESA